MKPKVLTFGPSSALPGGGAGAVFLHGFKVQTTCMILEMPSQNI